MSRNLKGWCQVCRDIQPDLFCATRGCRSKFHIDCLRNTGQIKPDEDLEEFICQVCKAEEAETECYKCHRFKEGATLLICDVCNRGAHIECVGLKEEPQGEDWVCPTCSPTQNVVQSSIGRVGGGKPQLGNVDICYVCQKGGKILCCNTCDQAFHPKCIDPEFLEMTLITTINEEKGEGKWSCPMCKGQDPLKNMGHKRMTRAERQKRSAECQKCVKVQSRKCRINRDSFLWNCRASLKPFVTSEVLARIRKSAMATKSLEDEAKVPRKKARKELVPPPVIQTSSAPFRRTTSTSMRAAAFAAGFTNDEEEPASVKKEDPRDQPPTHFTHPRSENIGIRAKRRRLIESDSEDETKENYEILISDERMKAEENKMELEDTIRQEPIKSPAEAQISEPPVPYVGLTSEFDDGERVDSTEQHKPTLPVNGELLTEPKEEQQDLLKQFSPQSATAEAIEGAEERVPIESVGMVNNSVVVINENEMAASVAYQCDDLLRAAEETAKKKKFEILREGVSLKGYQRWGVNWLLDAFENKAGAILADEMGLGKTIQTLAFLSALKCLGVTGPHLVVVPLSTVGNWAREIRRFTSQLSFSKICGSRVEREHSISDGVAMYGIYDVLITTYETCVTEEWFFTDQFKWQCVILDEAHRIKNESARIRHSLDRVDCNMRVLLTGTPLQNNVKELFTLLNFLFPDVLASSKVLDGVFQSTKNQSLPPKSHHQGASAAVDESLLDNPALFDESKMQSITNLLSNLMLRRTKDLVVRLPKKIEHDIWLPLSPCSASWYRRLLEITADVDNSSIRKLLGAVIKMRICCCHPRALVSREAALQRFIENFQAIGLNETTLNQIMDELKTLKEVDHGWGHVAISSKLTFLDKLLRQLHQENLDNCPDYKEEYLNNRRNEFKKAVRERKEKLEALVSRSTALDDGGSAQREVEQLRRELSVLEGDRSDSSVCKKLIEVGCKSASDEKFRELICGKPSMDDSVFVKYLHPWDMKPPDDHKGVKSMNEGNQADQKTAEPLLNECMEDREYNKEDKPSVTTPRPHKVLIFTQFQLVLNELEAYCQWRGWSYMRLDGSTNKMIRELDTREFNSNDSNYFVYLISTRAGGLGINLVTANHVVLFDEDWNPWVDRQAIDRLLFKVLSMQETRNGLEWFLEMINCAHRIGQVRNVLVWRLTTEWSVEERMSVRRQQKLKLDKLLIQANVEGDPEEEEQLSSDKLSTEEIRRLIQYGRAALMEMNFETGVENLSLEELMSRKRRDLKEVEGKINREKPESPTESEVDELTPLDRRNSISVREALNGDNFDEAKKSGVIDLEDDDDEVDRSEKQKDKEDDDEVARGEDSGSNNEDAILAALEEEGRAARPKRERKKPKLLYNPMEWRDKPKVERKLVRERYCFRCGDAGPPAQDPVSAKEKTSSKAKTKSDSHCDADVDPLVGCMKCPKVYHQKRCLGFDKVPSRSWLCPWHECCVCFRRSAAAGGILIHCAECPTAFCFDCFPPEYRRYAPPPHYFESLQKSGWPVTPQKLVTFLCSRCKALKEQERRRKLTKQQLEAENRLRKTRDDSAREDARKAQRAAKEEKQREADGKKVFLEAKKRIDDSNRNLESELKKAFEDLYMDKYLEFIRTRRELLLGEQKEMIIKQTKEAEKAEDEKDSEEERKSAEESQEKTNTATLKAKKKKRVIVPERLKDPGSMLKLCENCLLPKHTAANCPFPQEAIKPKIELAELTGSQPQEQHIEPGLSAPMASESAEGKTLDVPGHLAADLSDGEKEAWNANDTKTATSQSASRKPLKPKVRTVCALCLNPSRQHARRHCENLTDSQKEEYANRRKQIEELILLLRAERGSVKPGGRLFKVLEEEPMVDEAEDSEPLDDRLLDQTKRQLFTAAEKILDDSLRRAGLGNVIETELEKVIIKPKKKKKETPSDGKEPLSPMQDHHDHDKSNPLVPVGTNIPITQFLKPSHHSSQPSSVARAIADSRQREREIRLTSSEESTTQQDHHRGPPLAIGAKKRDNGSKKRASSGGGGERPLKRSRVSGKAREVIAVPSGTTQHAEQPSSQQSPEQRPVLPAITDEVMMAAIRHLVQQSAQRSQQQQRAMSEQSSRRQVSSSSGLPAVLTQLSQQPQQPSGSAPRFSPPVSSGSSTSSALPHHFYYSPSGPQTTESSARPILLDTPSPMSHASQQQPGRHTLGQHSDRSFSDHGRQGGDSERVYIDIDSRSPSTQSGQD